MLVRDVRALDPVARLVYWIKERHRVFLKKERGQPKPWTDDEIIQTTYFTNPYRENDKVTRWYASSVRYYQTVDKATLIFATIAFRWFNWIPTGELMASERLFYAWDCNRAVYALTEAKKLGRQIFTGAFNISNSGSTKPKINRVCEDYIQPVWELRNDLAGGLHPDTTLAQAARILGKLPGLGGSGFMAAQIVADLKYSRKVLFSARDWWEWCSPGPGSIRGLEVATGHLIKHSDKFREAVNRLGDQIRPELAKLPRLHAQDLQNCLCEYSKYDRMLNGDGRAKRKYPGDR